jgi:hypothetical protein
MFARVVTLLAVVMELPTGSRSFSRRRRIAERMLSLALAHLNDFDAVADLGSGDGVIL